MTLHQKSNLSKILFIAISVIVFGAAYLLWVDDESILMRFAVYLFGMHFVFSYFFKKTMYVPGGSIEPDKMPIFRFIVLLMGLAFMLFGLTNK